MVSKSIVGKLGNKVLWAVSTIGGLHLVESGSPDGSKAVLGAGSHRAVARMVAKRLQPEIEWTMLEKSQAIDERDMADILLFWEAVTIKAQQKLG